MRDRGTRFLAELTKGECFGLLARQQVGRVAVVGDRGPVVFPVDFVLDRHMVVFRTEEGTKLDAAAGAAWSLSRSMESTLRLIPVGASWSGVRPSR